MSKIVSIEKAKQRDDDEDGYIAGLGICLACGDQQSHVAPIGAAPLECSECHAIKVVWKEFIEPPVGEPRWQCGTCGGHLFTLQPEGFACALCGLYQIFD